MYGNSRSVTSHQAGIHPNLDATVRRHLASPWQKPIAEHTRRAFEQAHDWFRSQGAGPLVLDSGCGTGRSSVQLAACYPDSLVIGLDQSEARLQRLDGEVWPANLLLVRAECADFWRLAVASGWTLERHCLFYPNPWPKPAHLKRRWHGHPVFPDLLALSGHLEVRSNWPLYLEEMARALALAGYASAIDPLPEGAPPASDFERKYSDSGQTLARLRCNLSI